jgi:hypothetical protein
MHPDPNNIQRNRTLDMPDSTTELHRARSRSTDSRPRPYDTSSQGSMARARARARRPVSPRAVGSPVGPRARARSCTCTARTQSTVVRNHADRAEPVARWSAAVPSNMRGGGCRAFARSFVRDAASGTVGAGRGVTATRSLRLNGDGAGGIGGRMLASADGGE